MFKFFSFLLAVGGFFLGVSFPAWADTDPFSNPQIPLDGTMGSPSSWPTPSETPSPTPWYWAPSSSPAEAPVPRAISHYKNPTWMLSAGFGLGVPLSNQFQKNYGVGLCLDAGFGYSLTDQLSFWASLGLNSYGTQDTPSSNTINYTIGTLCLLARYRFTTDLISPYIFVGPGLSYNDVRNTSNYSFDPSIDQGTIPLTAYEFDLLLEGGFGLEVSFGPGRIYLQAKVDRNYLSNSFANSLGSDSPTLSGQTEAGVLLGL